MVNKHIDIIYQIRMSILEGIFTWGVIEPEEAQKCAGNMLLYNLGLVQINFAAEPDKKQKEKIYNDMLRVF